MHHQSNPFLGIPLGYATLFFMSLIRLHTWDCLPETQIETYLAGIDQEFSNLNTYFGISAIGILYYLKGHFKEAIHYLSRGIEHAHNIDAVSVDTC